MGYWEDYNKEKMGIPTGKIWSVGAQQARDEERWFKEQRRNNNNGGNGGGGNGCAYIILFIVVIPILLMVLPIAIPAVFSALFMAIILNTFGNKILSTSASPSFVKGFKWVFYTFLWYIPISTLVGFVISIALVALGTGLENTQITDFLNTEIDGYNSLAFFKLSFLAFIFQIPNILIAGAIFRRYLIKGFVSNVSYWRSTMLISFGLMTWCAITGIEFYLLSKYSPETFYNIISKYQYFFK